MRDLPWDDFKDLTETVRVAEGLEDRRLRRALAPMHYAVLYRDAGNDAPSFERFLSECGLDAEWDEDIFGPMPIAGEEQAGSRRSAGRNRPPEPVEPTDDNEWGDATIADLMEFKVKKEREDG